MKTTAVFAGLVAVASAAIQVEVRYSDKMVDVGNVDLEAVTRKALLAEAGSDRSILTDRTFDADNTQCKDAQVTTRDLSVNVKMNGAWGRTPGLKNTDMRDGLVAAVMEVLDQVSGKNAYDLYGQCRGTVWQDSVKADASAACGKISPLNCNDVCKDAVSSPGNTQCQTKTTGHSVPSIMRVTAYIDDALQPDDLIFEFGATTNAKGGGCGIIGDIAGTLAGYVIPVAGGLFAQGITLGCAS